jgi:hypothetical protein
MEKPPCCLYNGDRYCCIGRQVKKQFDAVREQQEAFFKQPNNQHEPKKSEKAATRSADDDYIEFEEIK